MSNVRGLAEEIARALKDIVGRASIFNPGKVSG
jgi:hypothetical protein